MDRIIATDGSIKASVGAQGRLAKYSDKIAEVFRRAGEELQQVLAGVALSKELDEDARSVAELVVAIREVGETAVSFANKLEELGRSVRESAKDFNGERQQRIAEADRVKQRLSTNTDAKNGGGRWSRWFGWSADKEAAPPDEATDKKAEEQKEATEAYLAVLAQELEDSQRRGHKALADVIAEVRRHAKGLGEKLVTLQPSWRGRGGGAPLVTRRLTAPPMGNAPSTPPGATSSPRGPVTGGNVKGLIRSLATAEGRQQRIDAAEKVNPTKAVVEGEPMVAPPAERMSPTEWRIRGVYEHQVLKAGLRCLDRDWPEDGLTDFPRNKDGGSLLARETLMRSLIQGSVRLQSLPESDVGALQMDIRCLTLRQVLRLRVHHIDYTPSGCGADTIVSVQGTHQAFLTRLDGDVFKMLGRQALGELAGRTLPQPFVEENAHRFGRAAVFLAAAAAAVPAPPWWCWWVTEDCRTFFHAGRFESSQRFPEPGDGGVLEVTDFSKADRNDPTGHLRWFDWKVALVADEAELSEAPPRPGEAPVSATASFASAATPRGEEGEAEKPSSSGAATAGLLSEGLLKEKLGSLKKTASSKPQVRSTVPDAAWRSEAGNKTAAGG